MNHPLLNYIFFYVVLFFVGFFSTPTFASNRYYADNTLEPTQGFAWDWSVGTSYYVEDTYLVGIDSYDDGIELDLNVALSYDNFYLDFDHNQLSGGLVVGYSLVDKFDWGLDLLGTNTQAGFDEKGLGFYNKGVVDELAGIRSRKYDFDVGLRLTRRFENSQVSLEYLHDVSGTHNGWVVNTFFSHILPWRNWEFRSGVGVSAYSKEFTNYYFGIEKSEVASNRPMYQTDIGTSLVFEFHAEYPINKDWVFLAGLLSTWFSKEIHDSPIISQDYQHKAKVGVRYVF